MEVTNASFLRSSGPRIEKEVCGRAAPAAANEARRAGTRYAVTFDRHKFQGDERDVMIFSPVVSEGITDGAVNFLKKTDNLFNVAITRARAA
jgi:hypothetical protein